MKEVMKRVYTGLKDDVGSKIYLGDSVYNSYQRGGCTVITRFTQKHHGFFWIKGIVGIEDGNFRNIVDDEIITALESPVGQEQLTQPIYGDLSLHGGRMIKRINWVKENFKETSIFGVKGIFVEVK